MHECYYAKGYFYVSVFARVTATYDSTNNILCVITELMVDDVTFCCLLSAVECLDIMSLALFCAHTIESVIHRYIITIIIVAKLHKHLAPHMMSPASVFNNLNS